MRNKGKQRQIRYEKRFADKKGELRQKKRRKTRTLIRGNSENAPFEFMRRGYSHKVLQHLERRHFELTSFFNRIRRTVEITIPPVFSISENPEETIKLLRQIYTIGKTPQNGKICFNYDKCQTMGLSASTILDVIILALEQLHREKNWDWELEGNLPTSENVRTILCASGLPYHLNVQPPWLVNEERIKCFETVSGESNGRRGKSSNTATNLTKYFDTCLGTQGLELNDEGKRLLGGIMGEVLENCDNHGGKDGTWYTQGHYQLIKGNKYGEMQLLFLNLGNTIFEGFKSGTSKETKKRLVYIENAIRYELNNQIDQEVLYTLLSLQEGISRLRDKSKEGYAGRGSGTVRMIQFFQDIGETEDNDMAQQLTILSGKVFINFNSKYKMEEVNFDGDEAFGTGSKNIIAFNQYNDIFREPDVTCVKKIRENFPGTVISLKFYLDGRYIRKQNGLGE